jgi:hypothetical protein
MKRFKRLAVASMVVLLCGLTTVWGQSVGCISGTIQDATGAVLPNAAITITNTGTNVPIHVSSLSDGKYLVGDLTPGIYEMAVEATGLSEASTPV